MAVKIIEFLGMNTHNLSPPEYESADKLCPYMGKN